MSGEIRSRLERLRRSGELPGTGRNRNRRNR